MTINTDVDIQNELPDSQDNDNNFIIVILVVIVCAILIIAGFFIVRLLMSQRQRKFIVEEVAHDEAGTHANLSNRKGLQKQGSQPKMDDQYVVENLDYLELTKKHNRKQ